MNPPAKLIALLVVLPLITAVFAQGGVVDPTTRKRMANMSAAKAAMDTLGDMMSGRQLFDPVRARAARKTLVAATRANIRLFRKARTDPLSRARPEVWNQWADFKRRARAAEHVARDIDPRSLNRLRQTLPPMLATCLDCHRTYRLPR